ncbi:MAG TPA: D-glycerate dehydrogenase [bacterium]|nr:D-glycerate dehydrogenase [bacterium]
MKPPVLVTRPIPTPVLVRLEEHCLVELNAKEIALSPQELTERLRGKMGLLCLLTDRIAGGLLVSAKELRVISNVAVGFDNVDVAAATRRGILVTNTPGILDETTADLAFALLLSVARRVVEGDRLIRRGEFREWNINMLLGEDVFGKTLGICGCGRIGQAVARRARGFAMRILYTARRALPGDVERQMGLSYASKETLLRESDFVSLHLPLTPETRHYITRGELAFMKSTAYLINTSRGPVVDESALVEALRTGRIAGAALDVFEDEPRLHPDLAILENVVLTPHIGSASRETRTRMAMMAAENLITALQGMRPPNLVNPQVLMK